MGADGQDETWSSSWCRDEGNEFQLWWLLLSEMEGTRRGVGHGGWGEDGRLVAGAGRVGLGCVGMLERIWALCSGKRSGLETHPDVCHLIGGH